MEEEDFEEAAAAAAAAAAAVACALLTRLSRAWVEDRSRPEPLLLLLFRAGEDGGVWREGCWGGGRRL